MRRRCRIDVRYLVDVSYLMLKAHYEVQINLLH